MEEHSSYCRVMVVTSQFTGFTVLVLLSTAILHGYLYLRLVRDADLVPDLRKKMILGLSMMALFIPLSRFVAMWSHTLFPGLFVAAMYTWLAVAFFICLFLLLFDLGRWSVERYSTFKNGPELFDPISKTKYGLLFQEHNRSAFGPRLLINRVGALAAVALALIVSFFGVKNAFRAPRLIESEIELKRMSPALSGLKIVHLSDLHMGPVVRADAIEALVERVNQVNPDVVVITGDLVDGKPSELKDAMIKLSDLQSVYGVFVVTGNHEYYSGADTWVKEFRNMGFVVLRNSAITIYPKEKPLCLAGVDDWESHHYCKGCGANVEKAVTECAPDSPVILLSHQPHALEAASAAGVDLVLAGHTHGGQIWPFQYIVGLFEPIVAGFGRLEETQIFVSRGTGVWGPVFRLGAESDFALHKLKGTRAEPNEKSPVIKTESGPRDQKKGSENGKS